MRRKKSRKRWMHRDLMNDICQFSLLIQVNERSENSQVGYENMREWISVALLIIQINSAEIEELDHHLPSQKERENPRWEHSSKETVPFRWFPIPREKCNARSMYLLMENSRRLLVPE